MSRPHRCCWHPYERLQLWAQGDVLALGCKPVDLDPQVREKLGVDRIYYCCGCKNAARPAAGLEMEEKLHGGLLPVDPPVLHVMVPSKGLD